MIDRPKIPLPTVYVPQGHVSLKEALVRAAEAIRPLENVRGFVFSNDYMTLVNFDPLREPPADVLDPFSWPPAHSTSEFAALEEARERLRWFMAEGHLAALGQGQDGELVPILPGFWRTDAGGNALRFPSQIGVYMQVFITDEAMGSWLADVPHWYDLGRPLEAGEAMDYQKAPPHPTSSGRPVSKAKLEAWLVKHMEEKSEIVGRGKPLAVAAARTMLGVEISGRFFDEVWRDAAVRADRDDLVKAGRKPKRRN